MNHHDTPPQTARPVPLSQDSLPKNMWAFKHTFRHGQCDPAGIVYTPKFFDIFNQAIEAWFCDHLHIDYYDVLGPRRVGLGYVSASATFFAPCMMGDEIEIYVRVHKLGGKSYEITLHAMKGDKEALRGYFTTVTTSLESHRPIEIPQDIRSAMQNYRDATD
ncbi:acyl-CoA thioesterase [Cochlodiniinecator piscidefendens]|uniref:acyl-CoA thioesterase n=1 Tax=Cochlodiniinecator piscidefendens TaxID=2715756 RepID=UPI00140CCF74|nr:thioesterase family protein [Cochlodiniinecator piscidefendens]